jgi:hypothetical protein
LVRGQHLSSNDFVSPDQLHMNDWSYACWAKLLGAAIAEAATRPVASAAAHNRHCRTLAKPASSSSASLAIVG